MQILIFTNSLFKKSDFPATDRVILVTTAQFQPGDNNVQQYCGHADVVLVTYRVSIAIIRVCV